MAKLLEFDQLVHLVEDAANALLGNHFRDHLLGLLRSYSQEVAQLRESDVHIYFGENLNVVLDECLLQHRVAITQFDLLMHFQLRFKLFGVLAANNSAKRHFTQ